MIEVIFFTQGIIVALLVHVSLGVHRMSKELDDLNASVQAIADEVPLIVAAIAALKQAVVDAQNGMVPASDVEAAATALSASLTNIKSAIA